MASRSTALLFLRFDYKSLTSSLHHRNKVWHIYLNHGERQLNVKPLINSWKISGIASVLCWLPQSYENNFFAHSQRKKRRKFIKNLEDESWICLMWSAVRKEKYWILWTYACSISANSWLHVTVFYFGKSQLVPSPGMSKEIFHFFPRKKKKMLLDVNAREIIID